jgi:hypothetical protein
MPAYPDKGALDSAAIVNFLNNLRFTLVRLLRDGTITNEELDTIIGLIKGEADGFNID